MFCLSRIFFSCRQVAEVSSPTQKCSCGARCRFSRVETCSIDVVCSSICDRHWFDFPHPTTEKVHLRFVPFRWRNRQQWPQWGSNPRRQTLQKKARHLMSHGERLATRRVRNEMILNVGLLSRLSWWSWNLKGPERSWPPTPVPDADGWPSCHHLNWSSEVHDSN